MMRCAHVWVVFIPTTCSSFKMYGVIRSFSGTLNQAVMWNYFDQAFRGTSPSVGLIHSNEMSVCMCVCVTSLPVSLFLSVSPSPQTP